VHVHDGTVQPTAAFDHALYCQPGPAIAATFGWERSDRPAGRFCDAARSRGVIDGEAPCFRYLLMGPGPNQDTLLVPPAVDPALLDVRRELFRLQVRARSAYFDSPAEPYRTWHRTARQHMAAISRGLAKGLGPLLAARTAEWGMIPYDEGLPEVIQSADQVLAPFSPDPGDRPCRLTFFVSSARVEPQEVALCFARLPDKERRDAIAGELRRLLDRVVSYRSSS
jgi:hypothetical protein